MAEPKTKDFLPIYTSYLQNNALNALYKIHNPITNFSFFFPTDLPSQTHIQTDIIILLIEASRSRLLIYILFYFSPFSFVVSVHRSADSASFEQFFVKADYQPAHV